MPFQLGFGLHVVQKKTSVVCWRWQQWGLGYIVAQFQTPPGESPNLAIQIENRKPFHEAQINCGGNDHFQIAAVQNLKGSNSASSKSALS